jgi:hypothetical protein
MMIASSYARGLHLVPNPRPAVAYLDPLRAQSYSTIFLRARYNQRYMTMKFGQTHK